LCQLNALHGVRNSKLELKDQNTRLVWWYDSLRFHVVHEANKIEPNPIGTWIPDVVHRFLVRLELGKGHSPRTFRKNGDSLQENYKKPLWNYGESEVC
jgi:hypothetical protein